MFPSVRERVKATRPRAESGAIQEVSMRARVLVLGLTLLSAAAPAGADTENLTGKWEGTLKCTTAESAGSSKSKQPLVLNVDENEKGLRIDSPGLGLFLDGVLIDEPDKQGVGTLSAVGCGFSGGNQIGSGVLRATVKTKAGDLKASLKGTAIRIEAGPGGFISICTFSAKRTNATPDPLDPCV
jgi:hypothetical protein